jgi:hypothetical protein
MAKLLGRPRDRVRALHHSIRSEDAYAEVHPLGRPEDGNLPGTELPYRTMHASWSVTASLRTGPLGWRTPSSATTP